MNDDDTVECSVRLSINEFRGIKTPQFVLE